MKNLHMIAACILCALVANGQPPVRAEELLPLQSGPDATAKISGPDPKGEANESARYIVVLKSAPLSRTLKEIHSAKSMGLQERTRRIRSHVQSLSDEQDRTLGAIRRNSWAAKIDGKLKHILNGFVIETLPDNLKYIESLPEVKAVYESHPVTLAISSSVPSIGAPGVWAMTDGSGNAVTGLGIRVGIIDTGIDYSHPALGGCFGPGCKVAGGYDFVNGDGNPTDDNGHGTHVAGIVAANDATYKGVAKDATLYAYKVVNASGAGSTANIILAMEAAADPDADPLTDDHLDVINMSLALLGGGPDGALSQEVDKNAQEIGMVVVVAAGNGGPGYDTVLDPGYSEGAITVGASDDAGHVQSFSSRGYYGRIKPDVLAPGYDILSAAIGGGWASKSGTSMAAPHVAGAAALLKQLHPDLAPEEIKIRLMNSALSLGKDPFAEGAGRIRVDQAATAETVLRPGSLMLGSVDYGKTTWSSSRKFNLVNASSSSRSYQLSIGPLQGSVDGSGSVFDANPAGYQALLTPASLTLDPGESKEIDCTVVVYTGILKPPAQSPYTYFGSITASDGVQDIRLPFAFIYAPSPLRQLDGWPVWAGEWGTPLIADLDNDGDLEVIIAQGALLYIFHHDGTPMAGWPRSNPSGGLPAVGDIDGDGHLEILIFDHFSTPYSTDYTVRALHLDGTTVPGWPIVVDRNYPGQDMLLADVDADRLPEVIVSRFYGKIHVLDGDGTRIAAWSLTQFDSLLLRGTPAAADLDGDGDVEILLAGSDESNKISYLYASHHTGAPVAGFPVQFEFSVATGPSCGDIDNDGDIEIVVATSSGKVYAWHHDGTLVQGWPISTPYAIYSTPALADLDGDGDLEIFIAASASLAYALHHNGTIVAGWPVITPEGYNQSPVIGDIDGDGDQEIVFSSTINYGISDGGKLNAYHHDGRPVDGFPFSSPYHFYGTAALADLDRDGDVEIIATTKKYFNTTTSSWEAGKLYAFDLAGSYDPANIGWGDWRHDLWGTSTYGFVIPRATKLKSFDHDGDGKADVAIWRPGNGMWYIRTGDSPGSYTATRWGAALDKPVPGDFDGDRKSDLAVWRPETGTWYIQPSKSPGTYTAIRWGAASDIPAQGDYDGDGKCDTAVWRPETGTWYVKPSKSPDTYTTTKWGAGYDRPVPGDFDGDGKNDLAVWRPSNGTWYIRPSGSPGTYTATQWGIGSDVPVPGDYDNDGKSDIAVWRPGTGSWYIRPSSVPGTYTATQWGAGGDTPVSGDYDGDGKADMAVWRSGNGVWYVRLSGSPPNYTAREWGVRGDLPISFITGAAQPAP